MTHCELGNNPLVEELAGNRLKQIRSSGSDYDFEESLLKCLHFLGRSPLPEKRHSFILDMLPKLEQVRKASDFSVYIAFVPWLECQGDGTAFSDKIRKLNAHLPRIPLA